MLTSRIGIENLVPDHISFNFDSPNAIILFFFFFFTNRERSKDPTTIINFLRVIEELTKPEYLHSNNF